MLRASLLVVVAFSTKHIRAAATTPKYIGGQISQLSYTGNIIYPAGVERGGATVSHTTNNPNDVDPLLL